MHGPPVREMVWRKLVGYDVDPEGRDLKINVDELQPAA
jgi:hypothetical protein